MSYENRYRPQVSSEAVEPRELAPCALPHPLCGCDGARSFRLEDPETRPQITSPEEAAELLVPLLRGLDREHCVMMSLDSKHRLIAARLVSIGSVANTFMAPREIFRDALAQGASDIVLGHNHPSGEPAPSVDDRQVSRRLQQAGNILGITVLDHLIVGSHDWVSMAREGLL